MSTTRFDIEDEQDELQLLADESLARARTYVMDPDLAEGDAPMIAEWMGVWASLHIVLELRRLADGVDRLCGLVEQR